MLELHFVNKLFYSDLSESSNFKHKKLLTPSKQAFT